MRALLLLVLAGSATADDIADYLKKFHEVLVAESQDPSRFLASRIPNDEIYKSTLSSDDKALIPNPPGSIRHHWARIFIRGAHLDTIFESGEQYESHARLYGPDIKYSKICSASGGGTFQFQYWTVPARESIVLNEATHTRIGPSRGFVESRLLAIREAHPPQDTEAVLCRPLTGKSMVSEIATQWRYETAADGSGVYVEAQSVVALPAVARFLGAIRAAPDIRADLAAMLDRVVQKMEAHFRIPPGPAQ
jgi:hypothetical protein